MILKKIGIILLIVFSFFPIHKTYSQTSNTGFISGNIWYSKDPFEEGDKIKIYTFVFNPDIRKLSGTVIFFDKTVFLGKKDFIISGKTAKDISIDWTATVGKHLIFAKIENSKFLTSKGKYKEVYLTENQTEKSSRTVSKKIISKLKNININFVPISNIAKTIGEKIPNFITKPIIYTTDKLEKFREDTNILSGNKKEKIRNEIKILNTSSNKKINLNKAKLNSDKTKLNSKIDVSPFLKPFKYVELFFLSISSFILGSKIIFYGILTIIIFSFFHYIWKKVF